MKDPFSFSVIVPSWHYIFDLKIHIKFSSVKKHIVIYMYP